MQPRDEILKTAHGHLRVAADSEEIIHFFQLAAVLGGCLFRHRGTAETIECPFYDATATFCRKFRHLPSFTNQLWYLLCQSFPKVFFFLILSSMVAPPNTLRAHEQLPHFQTFNSSHTGSRIPRSSLPNPVRVRLDSSEQNFGPPVPRPVHTHTHTHPHTHIWRHILRPSVARERHFRPAGAAGGNTLFRTFPWPRPKACMGLYNSRTCFIFQLLKWNMKTRHDGTRRVPPNCG